MATPLGHGLVGLLIARRMGVQSPGQLFVAALAASLPDIDIIVGQMLHRDPWRLHRKVTHRPAFAITAGMVAGFGGLFRGGGVDGDRDLVVDALTGAAIVGSHVVLDGIKLPFYVPTKPGARGRVKNEALNMLIDLLVFGAPVILSWPRTDGVAQT